MGTLTHATYFTLILFSIIFSVSSIPFSKYGRQCSDIGCLSNQVCVMAIDACSYNQRDGKECGRYPTCKKNTDGAATNGGSPDDTSFDRPTTTTRKPMTNFDDSFSSSGHNSNRDSVFNLPTTTKRPYSPPSTRPTYPSNPYSGGQGGGSNFFGGGGSHTGGGGGYSKPTTPSSGGGFFSGILGGLQDSLTNYAKNRIAEAITGTRGGAGGSSSGGSGGLGGLGGLFDTRNLIQNRITGGLFSENKSPSSSQTSSNMHSTRPAYYPTQPPTYNYMNRGSNLPYPTTNTRGQSQPTPPHYGWKID